MMKGMPDITAADLQGRTIKIESAQQLEGWACRVTFADTNEMITNIERIEIDIQATNKGASRACQQLFS